MNAFYYVFIVAFYKVYANTGKTEYQLMFQHRRIFSIVDNFHSLFCRGNKPFEECMGNIVTYNHTKTLGNQCSIPNKQGIKKEDYLDYDVIAYLWEDGVMYNYYHYCLGRWKEGANFNELKDEIYLYGYPYRDYSMKRHEFCCGLPRDISDFFNWSYIHIITQAFTDVDEIARNYQIETNYIHEKKQLI
jgi:hypothetical protein